MKLEPEIIGGYPVHPAASVFPLLEGEEFEQLVDSIRRLGVQMPIVLLDGVLLDGRNRLRAVERLRAEGRNFEVTTIEWESEKGETPSEVILAMNETRRHLSDDARVMARAAILPLIEADRAAAERAPQFKPGICPNPSGRRGKEEQATPKSAQPVYLQENAVFTQTKTDHPKTPENLPVPAVPPTRKLYPWEAREASKTRDARSTVGTLAAEAGVSKHKARQAVAVERAVARGQLPAAERTAIIRGRKKLRDVAPAPKPKPKPKALPAVVCPHCKTKFQP